jgi:hypothetical protein
MMTPICSEYDIRLVTLLGVVIDVIGEHALDTGQSPQELLAESLYRVNKQVYSVGEEQYIDRLHTCFPLLKEAIS